MVKDRFSQQDVNKEIFDHIPKPTLRTWLLQGLYGWVNEGEDKRGTSREYSLGNLYQIGIVEALSSLDISTDIVKEIMAELGSNPPMEKKILASKKPLSKKMLDDQKNSLKMAEQLPIEVLIKLGIDKKHFKSAYRWSTLILEPNQLKHVIRLQEEDVKAPVFVIIDLTIIKNFIDSKVKDI